MSDNITTTNILKLVNIVSNYVETHDINAKTGFMSEIRERDLNIYTAKLELNKLLDVNKKLKMENNLLIEQVEHLTNNPQIVHKTTNITNVTNIFSTKIDAIEKFMSAIEKVSGRNLINLLQLHGMNEEHKKQIEYITKESIFENI
jgi:hypothetical protein